MDVREGSVGPGVTARCPTASQGGSGPGAPGRPGPRGRPTGFRCPGTSVSDVTPTAPLAHWKRASRDSRVHRGLRRARGRIPGLSSVIPLTGAPVTVTACVTSSVVYTIRADLDFDVSSYTRHPCLTGAPRSVSDLVRTLRKGVVSTVVRGGDSAGSGPDTVDKRVSEQSPVPPGPDGGRTSGGSTESVDA